MLETFAPCARTPGRPPAAARPPSSAPSRARLLTRAPGLTRAFVLALGLVLAVLAPTACVAPTPTADSHRDAAEQTVVDLLSAVATGILVADAHRRDLALGPYLETTAGDAEEAARSIADTFGVLQPPTPEADLLRARLTPLCDDAVNALADLRIALNRDDAEGVAEAARLLAHSSDALTLLRGELS